MAKANKRESETIEALDRSPSHLLHRALQLALDYYSEEAGDGAPTQRQYAVLSAVAAREGRTQTDLVRATGIDRSTLADLVARMIGKGLLARERSTSDGRANAVRLAEQGRIALAEATPRIAAADERLLAAVSKSKRTAFVAALRDLARREEKVLAKAEKAAAKAAKAVDEAEAAKPKKAAKDKKKKKAKAVAAVSEVAS